MRERTKAKREKNRSKDILFIRNAVKQKESTVYYETHPSKKEKVSKFSVRKAAGLKFIGCFSENVPTQQLIIFPSN
jgi:hypothetical protein